jgi:hypothetical protein
MVAELSNKVECQQVEVQGTRGQIVNCQLSIVSCQSSLAIASAFSI